MDCPNLGCDVKSQRQFLQKHVTEDCLFKKKPCPYCGKEIQHQLLKVGIAHICEPAVNSIGTNPEEDEKYAFHILLSKMGIIHTMLLID